MIWGLGSPAPALLRRGAAAAASIAYVGVSAVSGGTAPTLPAHAAPSGAQKHLLVGYAYSNTASVAPGLNTGGAAWLDMPAHTYANAAGVAARIMCCYAASGSEVAGALSGANRQWYASYLVTNGPADPRDLFGAAAFVLTANDVNATWPGLADAAGLLLTACGSKTFDGSTNYVPTRDTIGNVQVGPSGTTPNMVAGVTTTPVGALAEQTQTLLLSKVSRTLGMAVKVRIP